QGPEVPVRHHWKQSAAVVANALADRAYQRVVAPRSCSSFRIACQVRGNDAAWQALHNSAHLLPGALHSRQDRYIVPGPVVWRVAIHAPGHGFYQISSPRQPLRRALKAAVRECPCLRPENCSRPCEHQSDPNQNEGQPTGCEESILIPSFHANLLCLTISDELLNRRQAATPANKLQGARGSGGRRTSHIASVKRGRAAERSSAG